MVSGISTVRLCHLCKKRPADSREHIPSKKTSNQGKVVVNFIDGTNLGGGIHHREIQSDDGFWLLALCSKCNNHKTGSRYGGAYSDFIIQVAQAVGIEDDKQRIYVSLKDIYPLRVIKQMFSMFLCAMPQEPRPAWEKIHNFVLNKDEPIPEDAPYVYLYKNTSDVGRIVPWCAMTELLTNRKLIAISEISWPPVGIIFSKNLDERFGLMANISEWGRYRFKEKKDILIQLPQLRVSTHLPLGFGTKAEVDRWWEESGVVWAIAKADYPKDPNTVSMVWRRSPD